MSHIREHINRLTRQCDNGKQSETNPGVSSISQTLPARMRFSTTERFRIQVRQSRALGTASGRSRAVPSEAQPNLYLHSVFSTRKGNGPWCRQCKIAERSAQT
ncbi:hypothetical protein IG631_12352 [Alternaria alternata]|nr:hypothetical protein IG631_12352 [Alternaria alternata]